MTPPPVTVGSMSEDRSDPGFDAASDPRADNRPVLLFGGPYGNRQATAAVLAEAKRRGITTDRTVCTGDLVAYCGAPRETIAIVRQSGIHVVKGNCDEQLAAGANDCGCGFEPGSACDRLSTAWYAHALSVVGPQDRTYLAGLTPSLDIEIAGARLRVVHGGVSRINAFVFASSAADMKRADFEQADVECASLDDAGMNCAERDDNGVDGIVGGHCGLPFSQVIDGRLWHNAGVIGMPANDGTPRVWYSVLTPRPEGGLEVAHCALMYDHDAAAADMDAAGLPTDYRDALLTGRWPSLDILPPAERAATGVAIAETTLVWAPTGRVSARQTLR